MAGVSVFDIFKIGIGPSSSHTVGPMKAARAFAAAAGEAGAARYHVTLHGSLAWTGKGHGTDAAILLGLAGHDPETIDPDAIDAILADVRSEGRVDIDFNYQRELERHTNGMVFEALDEDGKTLKSDTYFSLGGGFIARGDEPESVGTDAEVRLPYSTSETLLQTAAAHEMTIAELVMHNETAWRDAADIRRGLDAIWEAMRACMDRGLRAEGVLPGKMQVARRASKLYRVLSRRGDPQPLDAMEWVNAWAIAVNEENAAGGRVVTSPTNGAAGIIPAVRRFYATFSPEASEE